MEATLDNLPTTNAARPARMRKGIVIGRRTLGEWVIEGLLLLAGVSSILITIGIVAVLFHESLGFFRHVSLTEFLTGREWTPLFANARYGIMPLVAGTLVTTTVALFVAIPVGTVIAIYLSEYAPHWMRETLKPVLELLSA